MGDSGRQPLVDALTDRELDVVRLMRRGLTNREIADELVIAPGTVKWYTKQIYSKLGVRNRTEAAAVARRSGLLETEEEDGDADEVAYSLPTPLTNFVGRQREMKEIGQMLRSKRLLTLTGTPGTGKTRLALEVAAHTRTTYEEGVTFVDLAAVEEAEQVGPAMVRSLGLQEGRAAQDVLERFFRRRHMLVILDNFEHVVAAAPLVSELLEAAPRLSVLATSRQPLRVYGEQEYRVGPLPVPAEAPVVDVEALAENEAVRLFLSRAQAVRPEFVLMEENAGAVAAICRRLEGLPLAIELAAVQLKLFTPATLLARLEDRLDTLTRGTRDLPARQQTLRATIDWSHELLTPEERILFRWLSVFWGGGTLQAIEAVCGRGVEFSASESSVLDMLVALLDKCLIRQQDDKEGNVRVSMLETIREYGREKLAAAGEEDTVRADHARYFLAFAQQAEEDLRAGSRQFLWIRRLMADYENVRAALAWAFRAGDAEVGAAMVGALRHFWFRGGLHGEGMRWTKRALEIVEEVPAPVQARVLSAAGFMTWLAGDKERGRLYHEQALAIYRELGNQRNEAWTLIRLGMQSFGEEGAYERFGPKCREAVAMLRELADQAGVAQALIVLGELARLGGYDKLARDYHDEALEIALATGDRMRQMILRLNLGYMAQRAGAYDEAETSFHECLRIAHDVESRFFLAYALTSLAGAYARTRPERAARLIGVGERIFEELGAFPMAGDRTLFAENKAAAHEELGEEAFEAAAARGRAMLMKEAVAYALEEGARLQ